MLAGLFCRGLVLAARFGHQGGHGNPLLGIRAGEAQEIGHLLGLLYRSLKHDLDDARNGFSTELRLRYVDAFPMNSGVYVGEVDSYSVVDANASYQLPFYPGATVGITAS